MSHFKRLKGHKKTIFFCLAQIVENSILTSFTLKMINLDLLIIHFRRGHFEYTLRYNYCGRFFPIEILKLSPYLNHCRSHSRGSRALARTNILNRGLPVNCQPQRLRTFGATALFPIWFFGISLANQSKCFS